MNGGIKGHRSHLACSSVLGGICARIGSYAKGSSYHILTTPADELYAHTYSETRRMLQNLLALLDAAPLTNLDRSSSLIRGLLKAVYVS